VRRYDRLKGMIEMTRPICICVSLLLVFGCSLGSENETSLKPTPSDPPVLSCASGFLPMHSDAQEDNVLVENEQPCRNLSDITNRIEGAAIVFDLNDLAPLTAYDWSTENAVVLTGAADRFWSTECMNLDCYVYAAHEIQAAYVDFIEGANLHSKTLIFADAIKSTNKKITDKNTKSLLSAEVVLAAMFRRLEIKYDQSRFIPIET